MSWSSNRSVVIAYSLTNVGFATRAPSNCVEIGVWKRRLQNRVEHSSRDRDDRYGRLSVERRASAIDDKPVTERAEPLMAARMTKSSLKSRKKIRSLSSGCRRARSLRGVLSVNWAHNKCQPVRAGMAAG